ncbi:hypothetical protein [Mycobacterium sp. shizuoka-1]|uniref:hypothetical protein n=1 Tax=Mycobacterium sp. shizuoka-1 TaxID=2039281 RepID=UPI000C065D93|nr:hypothetical protein [Mycobacterium sp. shizuoka-1]GAY16874.1 hypothetical protein MSZK_36000 [Mycobacterium sp. shizuoka-1]
MTFTKTALTAVVLAAGLTLGVAPAYADPAPEPAPVLGEPVPAWAPGKPAEVWNGQPVVWTSMWGGRWGVWINGAFMPLSSNPVTNGG